MATRVPLQEATTETPGYRSPPSNLEAEQALLGALLVNNEAASLVSAFLLAGALLPAGARPHLRRRSSA